MSNQVIGSLLVFGPLVLVFGWLLWDDAWLLGMLLLTLIGSFAWAAALCYGLTLLGWMTW